MKNPLLKGLKPTHPGELLREDVFPAMTLSKTEIARRLGISRTVLYAILSEKQGITPAMALKLGRLFGTSGRVWAKMQQSYDFEMAEKAIGAELNLIEPITEADHKIAA